MGSTTAVVDPTCCPACPKTVVAQEKGRAGPVGYTEFGEYGGDLVGQNLPFPLVELAEYPAVRASTIGVRAVSHQPLAWQTSEFAGKAGTAGADGNPTAPSPA